MTNARGSDLSPYTAASDRPMFGGMGQLDTDNDPDVSDSRGDVWATVLAVPDEWPPHTDWTQPPWTDWAQAREQAEVLAAELERAPAPADRAATLDLRQVPRCWKCHQPGLERVRFYRNGFDTWRCPYCLSWKQERTTWWSE